MNAKMILHTSSLSVLCYYCVRHTKTKTLQPWSLGILHLCFFKLLWLQTGKEWHRQHNIKLSDGSWKKGKLFVLGSMQTKKRKKSTYLERCLESQFLCEEHHALPWGVKFVINDHFLLRFYGVLLDNQAGFGDVLQVLLPPSFLLFGFDFLLGRRQAFLSPYCGFFFFLL